MILVSDLVQRIQSALDAEGTDRYRFDRDLSTAINFAVEYLVSVFNFAFAQNKLSEENLRELVRTRVWQTSKYSRIYFNPSDTGGEIWSIIRVSPEPVLDPATSPLINPAPENSIYVPNVLFVRSEYSANRLTAEEWNDGAKNIFMAGNTFLNNPNFDKSYAYQNFLISKPGNVPANSIPEIEIRPYLDNQLVAVTYLAYPTPVTQDTDIIMFPKSLTNFMVDKSLNFISLKQGDGTNLYTITEREIAALVNIMS